MAQLLISATRLSQFGVESSELSILPLQKFHMNMFQNHMSSHAITHVITRVHMWFWNMFMWNFCNGCFIYSRAMQAAKIFLPCTNALSNLCERVASSVRCLSLIINWTHSCHLIILITIIYVTLDPFRFLYVEPIVLIKRNMKRLVHCQYG